MRSKKWFDKKTKMALGSGIVVFVCLVALFADWIAPYDPFQQDLMARLLPPCWDEGGSLAHVFGTDNYGRDLLSRLIYGSRISILIGVSATLFSGILGTITGTLAGYHGGRLEQVVMRLADAHQAFPEILLAVLIVAAVGGSTLNLIFVLGISGWMVYARLTYGLTRSLRELPYVEASASFGGRAWYIMFRHILPQMLPLLTVISTLQVAQMILQETALSFLGLGVPPPTASWGNMLAEGRDRLWAAPWIANSAGACIIFLVWGVNLLGNGLREHLDPKNKQL